MVLILGKLTRWGRESILRLTYDEAEWWIEGANDLEEEIKNMAGEHE